MSVVVELKANKSLLFILSLAITIGAFAVLYYLLWCNDNVGMEYKLLSCVGLIKIHSFLIGKLDNHADQ